MLSLLDEQVTVTSLVDGVVYMSSSVTKFLKLLPSDSGSFCSKIPAIPPRSFTLQVGSELMKTIRSVRSAVTVHTTLDPVVLQVKMTGPFPQAWL